MAQDDFYYYLKPAQNLAWFHRSTFDGTTLTNGYHPLYFLLLTCMSFFVHTLPGVFRFLWVLDTVSAAVVFFVTQRLFAKLCSPVLANALAVLLTALCFTQICDQMEVTLAIPLGLMFLLASFVPPEQLTVRRALAMGLLGALTFLSRLDAGLLIFLYIAGILRVREYRAVLTSQVSMAFLGACLPLPLVYFWINRHFFHTLLPISGMAKELRHGHVPSKLLPASFSGTTEMLVNVALLAVVFAFSLRKQLRASERVFLFAVLATPFLFYGVEMLISDWPVWNWYFYILRFSAAGMALIVAVFVSRSMLPDRYPKLKAFAEGRLFAICLCVAALGKLYSANYRIDHWMVEIQHAASILDSFAETHPGTYAMGDRAGMFAITTPNRVVQTEGLVMDRAYLEHIRSQENLRTVLQHYGVDYFVAFVFKINYPMQFTNGCFHAMEPSIAGPSSLRMRADFCGAPLFQFPGFDGKYVIYRVRPN